MKSIKLLLILVSIFSSHSVFSSEFYSEKHHGNVQFYSLGDFKLESDQVLRDAQLAYTTHGRLNRNKDNAILVTTWYGATHKVMDDVYIGPDKALSPEKYFIVVVNQLGNGLSTSPNNSKTQPDGTFPKLSISDDVSAQHQLLSDKFGIKQLALVVGGSMGAQQVWEWAVRYPDMVQRAAPIAGTATNSAMASLISETLEDAIISDPAFSEGDYDDYRNVSDGLSRHADLWSVFGFSETFYDQQLYKKLGFQSVDSFLDGATRRSFTSMEPNVLLSMIDKWQSHDVTLPGKSLEQTLHGIRALTYIMSIDTDGIFPPQELKKLQTIAPNSTYKELKTPYGHFALAGLDNHFVEQVDENLSELLNLPAKK
ncbi:alpha/beta fold hydrolase [Vibrio coralliilyticus]|uniref:alpha/beta fold hydrolase n=1 Tax=Vibrio coralliilyticus TaxID=190893 RepID=UPI0003707894|nr:alpha/beta fold hydrolase [Vibrio coralliilyticus]